MSRKNSATSRCSSPPIRPPARPIPRFSITSTNRFSRPGSCSSRRVVVIVLSGMLKSSRFVYAAGLLITLAAMGYSAWGFALRVRIAGRPPVTNMYETVIWASFIVSVLGFWFCVLPFTWPGLTWAWRLAGLPVRRRAGASGFSRRHWYSITRRRRTRGDSSAARFCPYSA